MYHIIVEPFSLNFRVFTVKLVNIRKFKNFSALFYVYLCDTVAKWKLGIQLSRLRSNWNASD